MLPARESGQTLPICLRLRPPATPLLLISPTYAVPPQTLPFHPPPRDSLGLPFRVGVKEPRAGLPARGYSRSEGCWETANQQALSNLEGKVRSAVCRGSVAECLLSSLAALLTAPCQPSRLPPSITDPVCLPGPPLLVRLVWRLVQTRKPAPTSWPDPCLSPTSASPTPPPSYPGTPGGLPRDHGPLEIGWEMLNACLSRREARCLSGIAGIAGVAETMLQQRWS